MDRADTHHICLGLMLCPGNRTCRCIPLALMYTETGSNPLCTTGCCPTDRHPGAVQRGRAGPCGRGYRFRPKPAAAIHDDAAARASEIGRPSRRVHPRACTRLCRHFRTKPALLAQASPKRSPTPWTKRCRPLGRTIFPASSRPSWRRQRVGWRPCFPRVWRKTVGTRQTNQRTDRLLRKRPPSGRWAQAPPRLLRQSSAFAWRGTVLRDVASQRNRRRRAVSAGA